MMIRKSGLFLLVVVPLVVLVWLYLARNYLVTGIATFALERMLGAQVRLEGVDLQPFSMRAGFERLRIADREVPGRYMLAAGPGRFSMNGLQLFARKLVVDEMRVDGVSLGGPCPDCKPLPPPPPPPPSAKPDPNDAGGGWNLHIPLPELNLDALKQELDVGRLTDGQKLASLQAVDKAQADAQARLAALAQRQQKLDAKTRLDAIHAKVDGLDLASKAPRTVQENLKALKEAQAQAKTLREEAQALSKDVQAEPGRLKADFAHSKTELDADVATAMRAAHLGDLDADQAGALVFGPVVMERFNWVLAQIRAARGSASADKQPQVKPRRRSGRLINYPVTGRAYPAFLVQKIAFSGQGLDAAGGEASRFTGTLTGLSSSATVYGQPMRLEATSGGKGRESWVVHGSFDHRSSPGEDVLTAEGKGVRLGDMQLSGGSMPERATSRDADVTLQTTLRGIALDGSLRIDANHVQFVFGKDGGDAATARSIRDVFAGFESVQLKATLGGTLLRPHIKVSSSIDKQFSERMKGLVGKRRAEAEARVRAQLEQRLTARMGEAGKGLDAQSGPIAAQAQANDAQASALQDQLDKRRAELEGAAKAKGAGKAEELKQRLRKR
jgi:uncharacterized protein (TIGR03545 family)